MIAANIRKDGTCTRYRSWEAALDFALRGTSVDAAGVPGQTLPGRLSSTAVTDGTAEARAHWFADHEPETARRILLELAEGASDVGDLDAMRLYLGFIVDMESRPKYAGLDADPFAEPAPRRRRTKSKTIETLTATEIADLIEEAPDDAAGLRFRAMVALMVATGLRVGECVLLKIDAIESLGTGVSVVHVPCVDGCKTGARDIPVADAKLEPHMGAWLEHQSGEWLFSTYAGTHVHPNSFNRAMRRYAPRAGIAKPVHAHMLRHTFATNWIAEGLDVASLQKMLGHRDPAMTMRYAHADTTRLREIVGRRG